MGEMLRHSFLDAIGESFRQYDTLGGARSTRKLVPIHGWFADRILRNLGAGYAVSALGMGGEKTVEGKYYPKKVDISVSRDERIIAVLSFKIVMSNYRQNSINYFENLLGETANIRRAEVGFAHFLVLRGDTPYYDKNKGNLRGNEIKKETLREKDLQKYIRLFAEEDSFPHKPEVLGIEIVEFGDGGKPRFCMPDMPLPEELKCEMRRKLSLEIFLKKFTALCHLKE